jgi:tRNA threonylcarbamoyladenosine biosynthesis protein TsaB
MTAWLAIDTATDMASVALHDGAAVLAETTWTSRRHHTVELAPRIDELLRQHDLAAHDLTGLAVAIGPGSYTGLRIGLALAKGLTLATGIPIVPVPTLDILAAPLSPPHVSRDCPLWAVLRAGRGRLVAACYPPSVVDWPDPAGLDIHQALLTGRIRPASRS